MGDGAALAMALPQQMAIHANIPLHVNEMIEQLPIEWKQTCFQLIGSAGHLYNSIREYCNTLESIDHLENLVNATTPPDTTTVTGVIEKCKNVADSLKNAVKDLLCNDRTSCEKSFEEIWEATKKDVLKQLSDEKTKAANNCVQAQAILSAVLIIIEIQAIYSVWQDITNAENIINTSKERDIPLIEDRIRNLKIDEQKLKKLIDENLRGGNQNLMGDMRVLTSRLSRDTNVTRNMINDVKINLNGQISCIAQQKNDQFRRGVGNTAQTLGGVVQYVRLAANLSTPYKWLQVGITSLFGILAVSNAVSYTMCGKKLKELADLMWLIRNMENYVAELEELIRQAEEIYLNNNPQNVRQREL